jgi:oxaloacetate decarboxylase alpha subunit
MDHDVRDKILARPRARHWQTWTPPDQTLAEVRRKFGGPSVSDEELVLRVIAGTDAVKEMLSAGAPRAGLSARQPLVRLIDAVASRGDYSRIHITRKDLVVKLERRRGHAARRESGNRTAETLAEKSKR